MAKQFEDIKIVALDDKASGPSGQGALMSLVLKLSSSAPYEWCEYFDQAWTNHIYMMKRRATASGSRITIIAMPSELQSDHIPELTKVVGETNEAYRKYHDTQAAADEAQKKAENQNKQQLSDLAKNLKFD